MCSNKECPMRTTCYRFMAVPNEYRQSYSCFEPKLNDCQNFIVIGDRNVVAYESDSLGRTIEKGAGDDGLPKDKEDTR